MNRQDLAFSGRSATFAVVSIVPNFEGLRDGEMRHAEREDIYTIRRVFSPDRLLTYCGRIKGFNCGYRLKASMPKGGPHGPESESFNSCESKTQT